MPAKLLTIRLATFLALGLAYFAAYPEDLAALLEPVSRVLSLSQAVDLGLYFLLGAAVVAGAVARVWGVRRSHTAEVLGPTRAPERS